SGVQISVPPPLCFLPPPRFGGSFMLFRGMLLPCENTPHALTVFSKYDKLVRVILQELIEES
ncbi:hypothetical protein, partial [Selenomonas noxia]|uniref:hypothetical protein n=1 Tax=Selenomonas noxia TaxID=135083 RepID=UPI0023EFE367